MYKKILFTLCILFVTVSVADAHVPTIVPELTQTDIIPIEDPILSQAFYGEMKDFPHTFEISSTESFRLFTQILLPDIASSKNNVSGIIIKLPEKRGRVTEVARLESKNAEWKSEYEPFGGDTYRDGPLFDQQLDPGKYRIEVHTPNNFEKHVLVIGTREEMSIGYFETLRRLMEVKVFFGKSKFRIIESPYVYVPLMVIAGVGGTWYYRRRIRKTSDDDAILVK